MLLNAGAALYVGGAADSIGPAVTEGGEGRLTPERPPNCSSAMWQRPRSWHPHELCVSTNSSKPRAIRSRGASASGRCRSSSTSSPPAARAGRSRRRSPIPGTSLIAEHKRRSPSAGVIREGATRHGDGAGLRARRRGRDLGVDRGGRSAGRSRTSTRRARATQLPILRKDFCVDPYQVVRGEGRGRGRRAPGGGLAAQGRPRTAARRGAGARPRRDRGGPRRARSSTARSSSTST